MITLRRLTTLIHFGMLHGGQALGCHSKSKFPDQLTVPNQMVFTKGGHPGYAGLSSYSCKMNVCAGNPD